MDLFDKGFPVAFERINLHIMILKVKGECLSSPMIGKNAIKNFGMILHIKDLIQKRSLEMVLKLNGFKIIKIGDFRHPPYVWRFKKLEHRAFDIWWYKPAQIYAVAEKS